MIQTVPKTRCYGAANRRITARLEITSRKTFVQRDEAILISQNINAQCYV